MNRPRKRFGQHFLKDEALIATILNAAALNSTDTVIEIGPGRGALTLPLLAQLKHLVAIEIDRDLYADWLALEEPTLTILNQDALMVDYAQWGDHIRLVGNLPYNISTPLLIHLLSHVDAIEDMHFMLQKEVVDRLTASPGTKAYGRLTVMIQAYCETTHLLDVPPTAFDPPPKVMSSVICLRPHAVSLLPAEWDRLAFEHLLLQAFSMRRKTLANNLKPLVSAAQLASWGLDPGARPETISVGEYVALAVKLKEMLGVYQTKAKTGREARSVNIIDANERGESNPRH